MVVNPVRTDYCDQARKEGTFCFVDAFSGEGTFQGVGTYENEGTCGLKGTFWGVGTYRTVGTYTPIIRNTKLG